VNEGDDEGKPDPVVLKLALVVRIRWEGGTNTAAMRPRMRLTPAMRMTRFLHPFFFPTLEVLMLCLSSAVHGWRGTCCEDEDEVLMLTSSESILGKGRCSSL